MTGFLRWRWMKRSTCQVTCQSLLLHYSNICKTNTKLKPKQVCSGLVRWISTKTFGAKLGELSSIPGTRYCCAHAHHTHIDREIKAPWPWRQLDGGSLPAAVATLGPVIWKRLQWEWEAQSETQLSLLPSGLLWVFCIWFWACYLSASCF